MTLTAVYTESDLSRVKLSCSSIPANADTVFFEVSTDGVHFNPVRGGSAVPVASGTAVLWDPEFKASALNTYRASYVDSAQISFVAQGTHATGNNAPVVPGLPAGIAEGDLMVLFAGIQNSGAGAPPATITGWSTELAYGPMAFYTRRYVPGDTAPTVTFTGGAAGASTSAFIVGWQNAQPGYDAINGAINTSAQNIATNFLNIAGNNREIVHFAWKQNGAATAGSTLTPFGATVTLANALGSGQSLFYSRVSAAGNAHAIAAQTLTVTGGAAAISRSLMIAFKQAAFVKQETATVTPVPAQVWVKFPSFPGQNLAVQVTDWGDVVRPSRDGVFDIVNRTNPGAVTDLMGSREVTITLRTTGALSNSTDLDQRIASGLPIFIQAPDATVDDVFTMYAVVTGYTRSRPVAHTHTRYHTLALKEVAAPAASIAGATFTWDDVIALYPTWNDVLADPAASTWLNLMNKVSTASLVVP